MNNINTASFQNERPLVSFRSLHKILRYVQMDPYAYYCCKGKDEDGNPCKCKRLKFDFKGGRYCPCCGHVRMMHYSVFNQKIMNPITRFGYRGTGKVALNLLKEEVLELPLSSFQSEQRSTSHAFLEV